MILPILKWPNPKLNQKSLDCPEGLVGYPTIVADMLETMYYNQGVGLAAIQVGVPLRLFVMGLGRIEQVFINPVLVATQGDPKPMVEGCLSFPGVFEKANRYTSVTVEHGHVGERKHETYFNTHAQVIQHELDHLDGLTMASGMSATKRASILRKLQKGTP